MVDVPQKVIQTLEVLPQIHFIHTNKLTTHPPSPEHYPPRSLPPSHLRTSGDLTHGGDGRVVGRDAPQGLGLHRGMAGDAQHQGEQALVPAEGLLGQLAARQGGGQWQMELRGGGGGVG